MVYVLVVRFGKTLSRPLFSATSTRPSGRKRTTAGFVSPLKTTASEKPGCLKVVADAAATSPPKRRRRMAAARRRYSVEKDGKCEAPLGSARWNICVGLNSRVSGRPAR